MGTADVIKFVGILLTGISLSLVIMVIIEKLDNHDTKVMESALSILTNISIMLMFAAMKMEMDATLSLFFE